jgi:alkanesulfonate monooxygenase SsuD/methylene tetrahydromethanopterin reductase-like flavin-dependent oxidoreductase (luciferase family)
MPDDVVRFIAQFRADVIARGRTYDPMEVGVARAVHFADTKEELDAALERRFQGHMRINRLAERPGDERARFARHDEKEIRHLCNETAIFGTADRIADKLEALRAGGAEYVIVNFGGSRTNIRRFAREIMPHFADRPRLADAAK